MLLAHVLRGLAVLPHTRSSARLQRRLPCSGRCFCCCFWCPFCVHCCCFQLLLLLLGIGSKGTGRGCARLPRTPWLLALQRCSTPYAGAACVHLLARARCCSWSWSGRRSSGCPGDSCLVWRALPLACWAPPSQTHGCWHVAWWCWARACACPSSRSSGRCWQQRWGARSSLLLGSWGRLLRGLAGLVEVGCDAGLPLLMSLRGGAPGRGRVAGAAPAVALRMPWVRMQHAWGHARCGRACEGGEGAPPCCAEREGVWAQLGQLEH